MENNMDNDKRLMLEGLYITGNRYYYSNKVQKIYIKIQFLNLF